MCMNKEMNNFYCPIVTIIGTLIASIAIAAVFFSGLISSITTLLYITLILGILGILYVLFITFCGGKNQCKCIKNSCLIPTSIGAIITSAFALSLTSLATSSITVAILIGAIAFFLISVINSIVNIIFCNLCDKKCCID